jgi:NADH-quinone oxidoreductase subunit N
MGSTSVVLMLAIAVRRSHAASLGLAIAGLAAAFGSLWIASPGSPRPIAGLLVVDRYALFFCAVVVLSTIAVALLSYRYFEKREGRKEELYVLMLVAATGSAILVAANHFASFFLGLELLSVSLYAMNAYLRSRVDTLEAGLKYLVLASASTAFLLFGMALVYAVTGTMDFDRIGASSPAASLTVNPLLLCGIALILTGFGFKLGLVPFHLWTPDVYQGAPAPVTAFVATVSKGAVFALMLRFLHGSGVQELPGVSLAVSLLAIASMCAGNVLALLQDNVKRILAYSSIAHMGYVLVALQAAGGLAAQAVMFYLVAYIVTTLGALGIVTVLSGAERDADRLDDYRGLFWRRPALGAAMTAMMLSLAGIPLTAGFLGKFHVVAAGASSAIWTLVLVLVLTSVAGLYYYLRVVVVLYATDAAPAAAPRISLPDGLVLAVLTLALMLLGTYPSPFLDLISGVRP